jgi:UDP-N-acetyl-D-mannosaminuronic acid dehydrogenase
MENTYRDVNIAIANEFSRLADRFGVDVWEAIQIANRHPRVKILNPGPGVGGHCISVDPWFFVEAAPDITPLIATARKVNDGQPHFVVSMVEKALGSIQGKHVAVLGLAYKPDVDDLRESPAIEAACILAKKGASVNAYEPFKMDYQVDGVTMCTSLEETVNNADLLLLLVSHEQFKSLDPAQVASLTPARVVIDTVNGWKRKEWQAAGFKVLKLGDRKNI